MARPQNRPNAQANEFAHLPSTTLAYVAGFLDGEGCISLRKIKALDRWQMSVEVVNTNRDILDWLASTFGGSALTKTRGVHVKANWKPCWHWRLGDLRAAAFLRAVYPYLRIKREQAELALEFQALRVHSGLAGQHGRVVPEVVMRRRREIAAAMTALNRRGLEVPAIIGTGEAVGRGYPPAIL